VERILSDDPQSEARGNGILEQLYLSLQLLAAPAQAQLNHFPVDWIILTDEMTMDFDHWLQCFAVYWKPSRTQTDQLSKLDGFLNEMSGPSHTDFWSNEALSSDPRWEEVRLLAKAVLASFEWPIEIPPPAREEHGMIIDRGSYFINSQPSS